MGYYITVTRSDGTTILNRWSSTNFFFDMVEDVSPPVGSFSYTVSIQDDGSISPGTPGTVAGYNPTSVSAMVLKR